MTSYGVFKGVYSYGSVSHPLGFVTLRTQSAPYLSNKQHRFFESALMGSIKPPISLRVFVVGGGICGLSAAIALRRAGHHVTVYEKYSADADAGAETVVGTNAIKVLKL
ncbi:uncharacterized protein Z519_08757 [Cladophialophora bantiana CBS 173.52]|uniref:FAD dependent oxidoreductase domain-containing protein n=1 Tax=Cladophialophora bantiana (strain ATCC 10958 / CBS 173.52 / CDC B-1940 / NIH 8579) TaxID=1442370 RepID=A0A0D2I280_CLAB1|nr:uncharacterized protein Z519_08757 [Cladophialophora bantiana CBS 173.52]KIW90974.1 hypothetical protein Z519_08757 [Cladophialophora bantiana CBS 173.52]